MKKSLITLVLSLLFITGFTQDLNYEVHGKYSHPIKNEQLIKARFISDIIPDYPAQWITQYVSVEITATNDGKTMRAEGANDTLNTEQISMLRTLVLGTDVVINIDYNSKNPVTNQIEIRGMHYSATLVPEVEAEYPGGYDQLTGYLKDNAIDHISVEDSKKLQQAVVSFTVNEEGVIADAQISRTSGDPETDELLLEVINAMPKWKPAEDSMGTKVAQAFEFTVGNGGC
jgi:TonB family protein